MRVLAGILPGSILRLLSSVKFNGGLLHLNIGTGDPAGTGQVFGLACALHGWFPPGVDVKVEPDFTQTILKGEANLSVRFLAAKMVLIAIHMLLKIGWQRFKLMKFR